ncbi:MAG: anaerobic ribonucleoside triphosphate reductase [Oscillospiraceae bacterium]|jgi:ribonucleoside-triphosphate reductase|nr:anaerobic ribonucleoside triphosphate reductase [Oscillospiraceae bacterium]
MTERVTSIGQIRKRDGRVVRFDLDKIAAAVNKAFVACYRNDHQEEARRLALRVLDALEDEGLPAPDVEHIQDIVERVLMETGHRDAAKSYILYRADRSRVREMNTRLMKIYQDITFSAAAESDIKRENANIDGDTAMGTMLKYGSEGAKQFYEMFILKPQHSEAHRTGDIHIHDMDFYTLTTTCCQIDIVKLFQNGFSTGHGFLREPNHIASYTALCCIAIQSNQNDQHGGQSVVNFDYGMALGVAKSFTHLYRDNILRALELICGIEAPAFDFPEGIVPRMGGSAEYREAEAELLKALAGDETLVERVQDFAQKHAEQEVDHATYKAMVGLVHNLNTMNSRAGAQTPFSSINYGMDTTPEGRCAIKNVLLATEAGLGHGETPIFPIQIFRVKEGVNLNPGDPNYDLFKLACRVSARRMYPNFSFLDAPFNAQYYQGTAETEIAYMGCRTRVIGNAYDLSRQVSNGRGNLSFTSINLPRLAILANGGVEQFFRLLDRKLDLVIDQITDRFIIQSRKKVRNFPFLMGQGVWLGSEALGWDDEIGDVLKHGTLTVGFIGLAETLTALTGKHHAQSEDSQRLGLDIIGHMRHRLDKESARHRMNFTLIATPAEGLSGRFVQIDRERFGSLEGVTDKEYYTNSFHVPVGYPITAFDKIQLEAPYHALTNAGHISFVEMDGDPLQNLEAFEQIIRAMQKAGIGYGAINHPLDRDPVCGYNGIIGDECPQCGRSESEEARFVRIRRITGYLGSSLERVNNAKRAEINDRVRHNTLNGTNQ